MRVPLEWLRELVPVPAEVTGREIADRLIASGLESPSLMPSLPFPPSPCLFLCASLRRAKGSKRPTSGGGDKNILVLKYIP